MSKLTNIWGEPQEYKGIQIYPFLMEDYDKFEDLIIYLLFEKNKISDIQILKMSYLDFLFDVVPFFVDENKKGLYPDTVDDIYNLLIYVFKTSDFKFERDNDKIILTVIKNDKEIKLNGQDFENIKDIILQQNAIPTKDKRLHPDVEKELEEAMNYMAKKQYDETDIEDQVAAYRCEMKIPYDEIKKLSIYQFRKELRRLELIKDYQIYKTAEMGGFVTFKQPIKHWTSHISNKIDYSAVTMKKSDFDNKFKSLNN